MRARLAGDVAWLNIKAATPGIARTEFDYPIPVADAQVLLAELCDGVVEKVRHHVRVDGVLFEVDEFGGDNQGSSLPKSNCRRSMPSFPRPSWLGREVSALTPLLQRQPDRASVPAMVAGRARSRGCRMLMIGVAGLELAEQEKRWLSAPGVAGVLLFARNYQSREQLIALCESIRDAGGDDC